MPIYVYKCDKNHITELVQKMGDKALEVCPQCGEKVKKQVPRGTSFKFVSNK